MAPRYDEEIMQALSKLGADFLRLNWSFTPTAEYGNGDPVVPWLGGEAEDVMVCVFKDKRINEPFHRQKFFFLHFAYRGDYEALSAESDHRIAVREGDCYFGQPFSGYAAKKESDEEGIIIGVLIRKEAFIQEFLTSFSMLDVNLLKFFLAPHQNEYADQFLHLRIPDHSPIWRLLGLIVLEYANKTNDSQKIIKPLVMTLCLYISSEYKCQNLPIKKSAIDQMVEYINSHADNVTLSSVAMHFGYHPVYISKLLPEKTGKTFSQIVTEARMQRAELLLRRTDLSIEKIAAMLGYSNSSNFYKAFKQYFGTSPRQFLRKSE